MSVFKLVMDAGHYPHTKGKRAPGDKMREYTFNSHVAIHVMNILKGYENVECHFVHRDDRDVPLTERVRIANNVVKADAYISIHANAHGDGTDFTSANGVETFVKPSASVTATKLAKSVQSRIVAIKGQRDRGVKINNSLHVIKAAKMPAILVEAGFMTNEKELGYLLDVDYKVAVAYAIVAALEEVFGIKKIANQPQPQPVPQPVAPQQPAPAPKPVAKPVAKPSAPKMQAPPPTLRKGNKGANVRQLQNCLNALNFKCGKVDGHFGKNTFDALKRFQSVHANPADGIYGKKSQAAMNRLLK